MQKIKKSLVIKKLRLSDYTYPSEEEEQEDKQDKETTDVNKFNESIIKKGLDIKNMELFNKPFNYQTPSVLLKDLYTTKDKTKNDRLVNVINIRLKGLKEKTEKMSKAEKEIEKPDKMVEIVEDILKFNEQQQQSGKGLKILAPNQMFNRLPIALAQLKAGKKSNKLKNEIRQPLYSLYRSKNMTEQILKMLKKNMALVNLSIYYTWKNIKSEYKNNKFKISAPTWKDTFDLPDGSYSIDDIQDYFEFIIKVHET